jgi:copper chaperone CopZ
VTASQQTQLVEVELDTARVTAESVRGKLDTMGYSAVEARG